jgi:eukaryotic-like serine/threonine-protein kinase
VNAADVLGGRYRLTERLGEGGMSVVWGAHDEVLGRSVAIKLLSSRFMADWASRELIRAEAQAVARLSHPHVAGVYDYGESRRDDGERVPYVVMELLRGPSLAELLEDGPLRPRVALGICAQIAAALSAAHAIGIVHRDVKPANVMLTDTGAKVVDFGVAAVIGDLSEHQPEAIMFGTPAYLAPERIEGGPVFPGTDVYALGLLLYRALTGELPWSAETTTQMLYAHMYVEPRTLPVLVGVPSRVNEICQRCLHKDPDRRPAAADVAHWLAQAAGISVPIVESKRKDSESLASDGRKVMPATLRPALALRDEVTTEGVADAPAPVGVDNPDATTDPDLAGKRAVVGPQHPVGTPEAAPKPVRTPNVAAVAAHKPAGSDDTTDPRAQSPGVMFPGSESGRSAPVSGRAGVVRARYLALASAAAAVIAAAAFIMSGGWPVDRTDRASANNENPSVAPGVQGQEGVSGTGSSRGRDVTPGDNDTGVAAAAAGPNLGLPAGQGGGSQSATPTKSGPGIEDNPTAEPVIRTDIVESPGGSISVTCTNNVATLNSATPAKDFVVKGSRVGPAKAVGAKFVLGTTRVAVVGRCKNFDVVGSVRVNPTPPQDELAGTA